MAETTPATVVATSNEDAVPKKEDAVPKKEDAVRSEEDVSTFINEELSITAATTPEQVLAAGGVTKRRRGASAKRRSPSSGARHRPPTPEPGAVPEPEFDLDDEVPVKPKKKPRDKLISKRSLSSPGDDRTPLPETTVVSRTVTSTDDGIRTETIVTSKREFKVERVDPNILKGLDPEDKPEVVKVEPKKQAVKKEVEKKDGVKKEVIKKEIVKQEVEKKEEAPKKEEELKKTSAIESVWKPFLRDAWREWKIFKDAHPDQWARIISQRNRCISALIIILIYCGLGGLIFRFTEGAFEAFYKCGVKRVKRNFVDDLWLGSHHLREEEWKSQARTKLMEFENQLHEAHEAGVHTYSGQRAWSFLNAVVYCLTVVTTIGYGHISPSTATGRAITIVYAIFGIPLFLILLADFGKLFTRSIKFLWAYVRRLYYTGSCRKVRGTAPVQEVMKGVQLVYDFATFRRPSQAPTEEAGAADGDAEVDAQTPLQQPTLQPQVVPLDGLEPGTPAPSAFEVDDEFNLPISIAIFMLLGYIFVGAAVYNVWEGWGFFESFYFVFISMSTIGFGDFVPKHPMYMMASIVYLVFGLALTSMCINVVQEKLSDSFRQASAKIGATIGLRMAGEDGTATPIDAAPPPAAVEVADVHPTIIKSAST